MHRLQNDPDRLTLLNLSYPVGLSKLTELPVPVVLRSLSL